MKLLMVYIHCSNLNYKKKMIYKNHVFSFIFTKYYILINPNKFW